MPEVLPVIRRASTGRWSFRSTPARWWPGPLTPADVFLLDASTGRRLGTMTVHSTVLDLTPTVLDADASEELLVGAGWQVYAMDVS